MVGGTLGIFGWGCAAGTLELLAHTRASSAEFCYPSCIPLTLALLRQRLYRVRGTPETIARILQLYNIRVAHKPITTLRRLLFWLMSRTKTNRRTDRGQYTRSNAATARLLTLVKPAET